MEITAEGFAAIIASLGSLVMAFAAFRQARGANQATNAIKPGEVTMKEQIAGIKAGQQEFRVAISRIEDQHLSIQHELGELTGAVKVLGGSK